MRPFPASALSRQPWPVRLPPPPCPANRSLSERRPEDGLSIRHDHVPVPCAAAWPLSPAGEALEPSFGHDS